MQVVRLNHGMTIDQWFALAQIFLAILLFLAKLLE